jgi:transketolase
MGLEPLADKWRAFGWNVFEVNGHDFHELIEALNTSTKKPKVIIAHTTKGKGVSFMEDNVDFHGKAPTKEEAEIALRELA